MIKKIIWIIGAVIFVGLLVFGISAFKKQYTIKQIGELPIQEEIQQDNTEEVMETMEETEKNNDPVKNFLSEKVENTMRRFFTKELKMVAIGDSLTKGVGDEAENGGYVGILQDTINQDRQLVDIENIGKTGNRSDQLIKRLNEPEIQASIQDADIILITIGANDIMEIFKKNFTNLTLDKFASGQHNYENRLNEMFTTINGLNTSAEIYLIGFYNPFKQYFADIEELEIIVRNWNTIGREVVSNWPKAHYIPIKDLFEDTSINYLSEDHFHPNHLGYELMAERILEYITNEGETVGTEEE